tara:strand:- start:17333 stop:18754 length:1422 start_codon:yes stop_codon:yes gene_type:complete
MPQSTNSAAFIQRKPLENTNIGAIVEEHVRYYESVKSADEAKRLAKEANDREFRRKLSNDRKKDLPTIDLGEAEGYNKAQRVALFESKAEEIADLKRRWRDEGDNDALLKLNKYATLFKSYNESTNIVKEYGKYIIDNKATSYNKYLDKGKLERYEKVVGSQYNLTEEGYNIINNEGGTDIVSPQKFNEEMLNLSKFSGIPDYSGVGKTIADSIDLVVTDGSQDITPQNIKDGILKWDSYLKLNPLALDTIAAKNETPITEEGLSENQIYKFAEELFNTHSLSDLQVKKNPLGDSQKRASTASTRSSIVKKKNNNPTVRISTDTLGVPTLTTDPLDLKATTKNVEVYNITNTSSKIGNGTQTIDALFYNKDTGVISAEVSLYEPVTETSTSIDPETNLPITFTNDLGKKVNTRPVTGEEAISRIGNIMGVEDSEGILKLINDTRAEQEAKKGNKEKEADGLTEEEMKAFLESN